MHAQHAVGDHDEARAAGSGELEPERRLDDEDRFVGQRHAVGSLAKNALDRVEHALVMRLARPDRERAARRQLGERHDRVVDVAGMGLVVLGREERRRRAGGDVEGEALAGGSGPRVSPTKTL